MASYVTGAVYDIIDPSEIGHRRFEWARAPRRSVLLNVPHLPGMLVHLEALNQRAVDSGDVGNDLVLAHLFHLADLEALVAVHLEAMYEELAKGKERLPGGNLVRSVSDRQQIEEQVFAALIEFPQDEMTPARQSPEPDLDEIGTTL